MRWARSDKDYNFGSGSEDQFQSLSDGSFLSEENELRGVNISFLEKWSRRSAGTGPATSYDFENDLRVQWPNGRRSKKGYLFEHGVNALHWSKNKNKCAQSSRDYNLSTKCLHREGSKHW